MRQKIQPGMNVDFVTPEELAMHFKDSTETLLNALGRNAQFKRVLNSSPVNADGSILIQAECPNGFLWDVRGVTMGSGNNGLANVALYLNQTFNTGNLILNKVIGAPLVTIAKGTVVAHANDTINMVGGAAVGGALNQPDVVSMVLWVVEVPVTHEAQLLL